jgi:anaerobic magnesium-protoporphyrin IX monomethyl ester cyclase
VNILFANLHWEYGTDYSHENMKHLQFPTGLAIIAAEIKKARSDDLFIIDNYLSSFTDNEICDFISDHQVDCVLLSMYLGNYQYRYLKRLINNIAIAFPFCKVIIGGPMATTIPHLLLENTVAADEQVIAVIGEGEATIVDLLACIEAKDDLTRVKGIALRKNNTIVISSFRPRLMDLDEHPYPDYELFETQKYVDYVKKTNRCWEISTSRGCFGECAYCKLVFGRKITMRSPQSVINEMTSFNKKYGISRFNFVDDNFLNNEEHAINYYNVLKLCDVNFLWRFQGRADRFSPKMAQKLVDVGLYDVSFGLESGAEVILKEMNKKLDLDRAKENLKSLPGILNTHASFVVGMPSESYTTIDQTIKFIHEIGLKNVTAGILTIFPDTHLYELSKTMGLIENEDLYCDNLGPVYTYPYVNLTSYSNEQLLQWASEIIHS